jgi:creatinine amidohydrolase
MAGRRFAELRFSEIADRVGPGAILIQPVGAVEQHGPHLPLNTDDLIATAAADALIAAHGDALDLFVLPPLSYSKSNEHAWAAGSIWQNPATMLAVLDDLGRSLAPLAAHKLVFLNGHGGNTALLNVACRELRLHHGLTTFLAHPAVPPDSGGGSTADELGMGIHAGLHETAMVLHLRPDLVDMSLATPNVPEALAANRHVRFGGEVSFGWLADDFGAKGHIGDPTGATAELGKELFEACVDRLGEALGEVADFDFARFGGSPRRR